MKTNHTIQRCEPAVQLSHNSNIIGGWLAPLMVSVGIIERIETKLHPTKDMNPRAIFTFAVLIAVAVPTSALEEAKQIAPPRPDYAVVLHYGKETELAQETAQLLHSRAVELLETSNFNSRGPRRGPDWDISKLHEEYRQTVSGKYLLLSFKEPRKIETIGGKVSVREIVIGLNGPQYASALFTIDDEGRLVGHAKYSGTLCVKLLEFVKKIANDS